MTASSRNLAGGPTWKPAFLGTPLVGEYWDTPSAGHSHVTSGENPLNSAPLGRDSRVRQLDLNAFRHGNAFV